MVEESIAEGTNWIVFEPNDATLWKHIRRDIGAFLRLLWRDGALMGATPEEAFFVKCDAETNPPEVIAQGQVVTVIGMAPVRPAEFIVFRISQSASGAETESGGSGNA
jgi:phage tail sheath protein FI